MNPCSLGLVSHREALLLPVETFMRDCSSDNVSNDAEILAAIQQDTRYLANLDWGAPRPGHPEGTVRAHLAELERNLDAVGEKLTERDRDRLRLVIHTHDTFKADARPGVAIADPHSHASLACRFLAEFCDDADVLHTVQWHDEPYALWRKQRHRQTVDSERLHALLRRTADWDLFLAFQIIDGCTAGKSREPLEWFFAAIAGRASSRFSAKDILSRAGV